MRTRTARGKYSREKIELRKLRQSERQAHIDALHAGEVSEELPSPLFPSVFKEIEESYWTILKSVPDPRSSYNTVYPLHLILHRVISGFIGGTIHIGVLFPKKRIEVEAGKRKLGALPTRGAVYKLLRRIDWMEAHALLSPLWERLGYTPDLLVRRRFRSPKEILEEFREEPIEEKSTEKEQKKNSITNSL